MFGKPIRLFRIKGIPVQMDLSVLIIGALVVFSQNQQFSLLFPSLSSGTALALGVIAAAMYFGSILIHELAHAAMARSLNIPVKSVTLWMFGGFTMASTEERPKDEFLVAVVGPATNLVVGGTAFAAAQMGSMIGEPMTLLIRDVAGINLLLAVFNIVPGFPLDGGRVLRSIVWSATKNRRLATRIASWGGILVAGLLAAYGVWLLTKQDTFGGIWALMIATFLFGGARAADSRETLRGKIPDGVVADAMEAAPTSMPAEITLAQALDYFRGNEGALFPVVDTAGKLAGVIDFPAARRVGQHDPMKLVRDAMRSLDDINTVNADASLEAASATVATSAALVLRDGTLVGIINMQNILAWANDPKASSEPGPVGTGS